MHGSQLMLSLAGFIITYSLVFGAGGYYVLQLIRKGPEPRPDTD